MRPRGTSTSWGSATASFPRSTRVSCTSGWGSAARGAPPKAQPGARDPVGQNAMGFTHGTGAPVAFGGTPTRSGWWLADQVGGTFAAMGVMSALFARERFLGTGQFVGGKAAGGVMRIIDYNWGWYGMV